MLSTFSGVLFDLYGTLFTYGNMTKAFALWHADLARAISSTGHSVSVSQISKQCKKFFAEPMPESDVYTSYELRLQKLSRNLGFEPDKNWIKNTAEISMDRWQTQVPLHSEAKPLLKKLRIAGIRVGAISNFEHAAHVRKVLKASGLGEELDAIIISGEVHCKKPDPKIFNLALKALGTEASRTIFVGDDPERDIKGAKSVGMQTKLFQNGASLFSLFDLENL